MNPLRLFWGWKPRKIECFRATNQSVKQLPILEKRKIQAEVLGPVFHEMVEQVGSEKAASILKEAIRKAAIEEGKHFREKTDASLSTMDQFVELMELWKAGGALEMEVLQQSDTRFDFNVQPLPLCRNVSGDGSAGNRAFALMQPGRQFLRGL